MVSLDSGLGFRTSRGVDDSKVPPETSINRCLSSDMDFLRTVENCRLEQRLGGLLLDGTSMMMCWGLV